MTSSHETASIVETHNRAEGFGLEAIQVDRNAVDAMCNAVESAAAKVHAGGGPIIYIEAMTGKSTSKEALLQMKVKYARF